MSLLTPRNHVRLRDTDCIDYRYQSTVKVVKNNLINGAVTHIARFNHAMQTTQEGFGATHFNKSFLGISWCIASFHLDTLKHILF